MRKVTIVDYGTSNLASLVNALMYINVSPVISREKKEIEKAERIIIPGVGTFNNAMENLINMNLVQPIKNAAEKGTPILGICLGMQIFFSKGYENKVCKGMEIIPGKVLRFDDNVKIPHTGWNTLNFEKRSPLFKGIKDGEYFYFVHSFIAEPDNQDNVISTTSYGGKFCSSVNCQNIFGVQFHPEKSHNAGLQILKNFITL